MVTHVSIQQSIFKTTCPALAPCLICQCRAHNLLTFQFSYDTDMNGRFLWNFSWSIKNNVIPQDSTLDVLVFASHKLVTACVSTLKSPLPFASF